jgi:hypothetical protein
MVGCQRSVTRARIRRPPAPSHDSLGAAEHILLSDHLYAEQRLDGAAQQPVVPATAGSATAAAVPAKVTVADWLDGSVHILAKTRELPYSEITEQVLEQERRKAG